ncbi:tetratricopeptide repeat-containing sensor histidine kinase [Aureibaculum luteum]|uniref:tetratricopeptide repeat-containing sensor histidine kinase n=1 Tax=Aureibaculum luteum TaxID=1548456 RepID=UPI0018E4FE7D|nr:tetratricopeptide repeat protein [Aureibaculum luteum]
MKTSFLFFYLCITTFSCIEDVPAQQSIDSSYYYYSLIFNPKKNTDLTSAFVFYNNQKNQSLIEKDTLKAINDLRLIAIIQNKIGFLNESENSSVEALKLLDQVKASDSIIVEAKVGLFNHLGKIYRNLELYDKAIEFYNNVLDIAQTQSQITTILNNRAFAYYEQKKYDLAIIEFNKIYKQSLLNNNKKSIARALDNLGLVQSKLNYPVALSNIKEGLKIREDLGYVTGVFTSYLHLTEYYKDRNQKNNALFYAKKALDIANTSKSLTKKESALSFLMDLNDNPEIIEFKRITDSISKVRLTQKNGYASIIYDLGNETKRANENKLKEEKEKRLKLWYQAIGIFIFLGAIFLYFILRSKYKKNKIEQIYKTETRISKKVHDEVANEIYHAMIKLQDDSNTKEEILDDLEDIYSKTREISKENSTIDFTENFESLLNDLLLSYEDTKVNVITRNMNKINWGSVSDLKKTAIYRVLQELMTNMKKHSKASNAVLHFSKLRNRIIIEYKDDGVGCIVKKKGGLQNAENRIKQVNGTITFESQINNGFTAKIIV